MKAKKHKKTEGLKKRNAGSRQVHDVVSTDVELVLRTDNKNKYLVSLGNNHIYLNKKQFIMACDAFNSIKLNTKEVDKCRQYVVVFKKSDLP